MGSQFVRNTFQRQTERNGKQWMLGGDDDGAPDHEPRSGIQCAQSPACGDQHNYHAKRNRGAKLN